MDSSPVSPGEVLAGKYKVERVLGVGGMGVVLSAMHMQLDQRVALKFLLPEVLGNAEVVARFAREARAAAKISSEHVARVIDVGTLPNGSPFIVMEHLDGHDLATELEMRGPLPVAQAVTYVLQACEAIAEAHAAGIIHRDLKPANLFLAKRADRGTLVKVLDFGISKSTVGPDAQLTKTATLVGSPFYMSPEQLTASKSVDPRSDVWALGIILHELLTGRPPFVAETMPEVVAMIIGMSPPPARDTRADIPWGLSQAIARCLERRPADRFQNVEALARALAPFGESSSNVSVERISRVLGSGTLAQIDAAYPMPAAPTLHERPANAGLNALAATDVAWQHNTDSIQVPKTGNAALVLTAMAAFGLVVGIAAVIIGYRPTMGIASARSFAAATFASAAPSAAPVAPAGLVAPPAEALAPQALATHPVAPSPAAAGAVAAAAAPAKSSRHHRSHAPKPVVVNGVPVAQPAQVVDEAAEAESEPQAASQPAPQPAPPPPVAAAPEPVATPAPVVDAPPPASEPAPAPEPPKRNPLQIDLK